MADDVRRTLHQALAKLNSDKTRIDRQVSAIETALGVFDGRRPASGPPRRRHRMSAAARKAVGKRMKAYWAKRRANTKSSMSRSKPIKASAKR
jgi:hypothetical protein